MFGKNCSEKLAENNEFCNTSEKNINMQDNADQAPPTQSDYSQVAAGTADNRIIYMLAYLGVLFFLPILVCPESPKAKFHANQGLLLLITYLAGSLAMNILRAIFGLISLAYLINVVFFLFGLGLVALAVIGMINAYNDRQETLPIIGKLMVLIK